MDYLNGFSFTLDKNNSKWKKYFDSLGKDNIGVYSVSKYFYDNLRDVLLKIFENEIDITSLNPLSEKSLNLSKDSFNDWNLTYKDLLSEGEMCCIAIPGYLYKGSSQSCFSIVNNIVKKQVILSDSISISDYAQLVEDLFVLRFGEKPQDLTNTQLEYFIPAQQIVVSKAVINTVEIKDNKLEAPRNPEVKEVEVHGYFYKRSTGQADSKNMGEQVDLKNTKKVYSVEDFKDKYYTSDCIDLNCDYDDFRDICYVISKEGGSKDLDEYKCISFASYNYSSKNIKTWHSNLNSSYSSVKNKKKLEDSVKTAEANLSRRAVIYLLEGNTDITNGATKWDGTDFIAFGYSETKYDANKLGSNKFREYKFIEIPKDIYTKYKDAQPSTSSYKCSHDTNKCKGTHKHINGKAVYSIPASTFTDENNLTSSGNFYWVDDNSTNTIGISATIAAGRSIFWKETITRLTTN